MADDDASKELASLEDNLKKKRIIKFEDELDNTRAGSKLSQLMPQVNETLIYCKLFYLCYNAALGSLWPYLPLYFRQLFLTPKQVGTIVACRTFVQFICVPFWIGIAEKYKKHKPLLLIAITSWLVSTVGILLVPREEPRKCLSMENHPGRMSNHRAGHDWFDYKPILASPVLAERVAKRDTVNATLELVAKFSAYDPEKHVADSSQVFILTLLCTIVGVSIASPTQVLADICTIKLLHKQEQTFGKQVLWGAVGFGICAFSMGTVVSFWVYENPCTKQRNVNYVPCFYVFAFFMVLALIVASRFAFDEKATSKIDLDETVGSFWEGLRTIHDIHLAALLVVAFYCGVGNGFLSTFLFWHLREMGGWQILLALVSLTNSLAELMFYLICDRLMRWISLFRLIYLGLLCFAARFFYYCFLRQPWLVLPIEITHGMTSAAIRSAIIAYIRQEGETGNILHGVFNGIHVGLGFSIGGLVGGWMVNEFGHAITFLIFGEITLIVLFCFILVNNVFPYTKFEYRELEKRRKEFLTAQLLKKFTSSQKKSCLRKSSKTSTVKRRNSFGEGDVNQKVKRHVHARKRHYSESTE